MPRLARTFRAAFPDAKADLKAIKERIDKGVTVTVTNQQTGATRTTRTSPEGTYSVVNLPLGPYTVAAEFVGFGRALQRDVGVTGDATATVDLTLAPRLEQTVTVTGTRFAGRTTVETAAPVDILDAPAIRNSVASETGKILQLGSGVSLDPELRDIARPHLVELRDVTDETVHLGVRDGNHVVYIDKIEGSHPVRLVSAVGQIMPLHTTALGKSALAWMDDDEREPLLAQLELVRRTERSIGTLDGLRDELERTRERGFAIDDRENEDHAVCVGAPILDAHQRVVGMISVSGPSYRISERVDELGKGTIAVRDVMTTKLLSLSEQEPDFTSVLEISRMLREQINWDFVRERTQDSPFAKAFFTLVEELGIVDEAA